MSSPPTSHLSPLISHLLSPPPPDAYEVAAQPIGQWTLIWARFRRHRLAVIGAWIMLAMILLAVAGPFFAPPVHFFSNPDAPPVYTPPRLWPFSLYRLMGLDPSMTGVSTYVLLGGRATLVVGVLGSLLASLLGGLVGGVAGYFGRFVDSALMRVTDAFLTVPLIPALVLLSGYLPYDYAQPGADLIDYALLFGLVGWAGVARLVRGYVLSLRKREFADAARALGASDLGIIFRHLLPNALDVLVVSFTLNIAIFIVALASLDFLVPRSGYSTYIWQPQLSIDVIYFGAWWVAVFPAIPLLLTVLAVNFLGDGLRDALVAGGESELVKLEGGLERKAGALARTILGAARFMRAPILALRGLTALARLELVRRRAVVAAQVAQVMAAVPAGQRLPAWAVTRRPERIGKDALSLHGRRRLALGIAVPLVLLLAADVLVLLGHSPLRYAPHFPAPVDYIPAEGPEEFGAQALPGGGWKLLAPAPSTRLTYAEVNAAGRIRQLETLGAPGSTTPSIAAHGRWTLGVWVPDGGSTIQADWLGTRSMPFALVPGTGTAEHPYALAVPGGFDILFSWQRAASFQIFLAFLPDGARHPAFVRQIAGSRLYGFYPRAVLDGSGRLDVIWIDRVRALTWSLRFGRFTVTGRRLGGIRTIGGFVWPLPPPSVALDETPIQWAVDLKRAPDGSVWAAWEENNLQDSEDIAVAHWSRTGRLLVPPTPLLYGGFQGGISPERALGLAVTGHGGQIYFVGDNPDGGVDMVTDMQAFGPNGNPSGAIQRVNYDGGGNSASPHAATVGGQIRVIWERVPYGTATIEGTTYRPRAIPADLLTRLGVNIGSLPANLLLLLAGSLAGGIGIAAINVVALGLLLFIWLLAVRMFPRALHVPVYFLAIALLLAEAFGSGGTPPGWIFFIGALGSPYGWLAAGLALFAANWGNLILFRRTEPFFRASLTALTALYVVGALYAVIFIQSELTRV